MHVREVNRVEFFDVTRGLLFLLMASSHALTLAGVSKDSPLWGQFWLPNGWATTSFIMLSGLTIPIVYRWKDRGFSAVKAKVHRRAKEILLVMFCSNVIMLVLKLLVQGRIGDAFGGEWWLGLVTFHTPYSISAILIPTGLLMYVSPYLVKLESKVGWGLFGLTSLGAIFSLWLVKITFSESSNRVFQILFSEGIGGFPVLPFLGLGMAGMSVGFFIVKKHSVNNISGILIALMALVVIHNIFVHITDVDISGFRAVSRFSILCCIGVLVTNIKILGYLKFYFSLIGRFALFSFLFHRVILQVVAVFLAIVPVIIPNEVKYSILLFSAMALIGCFCLLRQRVACLDVMFKRLYL
ncbi:hypothetical protein A9Q89_09555 [Gammaproteobacteria bacterium 53_120_T64]|mgnify:CR=1 FL=1|nr:hypothetical protein A9Q89_09555 [Gammaproteobacteria bacterium 53_120_T64]